MIQYTTPLFQSKKLTDILFILYTFSILSHTLKEKKTQFIVYFESWLVSEKAELSKCNITW